MMPIGFQVAGLLADQHRAELLRQAARRRQLVATREVTLAAAAGVPSAGNSRS